MIALEALAVIEERASETTPGPMSVHTCAEKTCSLNDGTYITAPSRTCGVDLELVLRTYQGQHDTTFYQHARDDITALAPIVRAAIALEQAERPVDQVVARHELRRVLREAGLLCTIEHVAPTSLSCACGRPR